MAAKKKVEKEKLEKTETVDETTANAQAEAECEYDCENIEPEKNDKEEKHDG